MRGHQLAVRAHDGHVREEVGAAGVEAPQQRGQLRVAAAPVPHAPRPGPRLRTQCRRNLSGARAVNKPSRNCTVPVPSPLVLTIKKLLRHCAKQENKG